MPIFTIPLHEFNPCHLPGGTAEGGQFCSDKGARPFHGTAVGITSARPGRSNREVFSTMREFEGQLKALPGVKEAKVRAGLGAWEGGSEPTWVVSYKGNGAAKRLIAQTAKRFDQDGVLMIRGCKTDCDPMAEFTFDKGVSKAQRDAIHELLISHGLGGWTWFKSGKGKTTLRAVSVPAWGGDATKHAVETRVISRALQRLGYGHRFKIASVKTEIMDRSSYDTVGQP